MADCPICDEPVTAPTGTVVGEVITCASCEEELEVLETEPALQVDLVPRLEIDSGE